jgi:tellurite methyltransferase|tara:strand:- start:271 stop:909 length:639 start_codon:yes stop_codon:yes gene_type:complete
MKKNKEFWDKFYLGNKKHTIPRPSSFASFFYKKFLKKNNSIIEIGCGNGRDTFHFFKKTKNIVAVDQSKSAINENIKLSNKLSKKIKFINCDFEKINKVYKKRVDFLYARFFLHTINLRQENILIKLINSIKINSDVKIVLEFRTSKDRMKNKGKVLSQNTSFTDHYRRFINVDDFLKKLKKNNFKVLYIKQGINLSKTKNDNPHLCRLVFE